MLIKILIIAFCLVGLLLLLVAFQPSSYRLSRSLLISADSLEVFARVNSLEQYAKWNPFGRHDLTMKTTFEGPAGGPGAAMNWAGNSQVGAGRLTITDAEPNQLVRMNLDFIKPFPATATTEFLFALEAGQTRVSWNMFGQRSFIPKAIGLFVNIDGMVGVNTKRGSRNSNVLRKRIPVGAHHQSDLSVQGMIRWRMSAIRLP